MIYINRKINIKPISYVLCDFDRTITKDESATTWGVFSRSRYVDDKFVEDTDELFKKYRPIELDQTISDEERLKAMRTWPIEQTLLFDKHGIDYDIYKKIIAEDTSVQPREDFKEFAYTLNSLGITLYIVSAGIKDCIIHALRRNDSIFPCMRIISNEMNVYNGRIVGLKEPILHSFNKEIVSLTIDHGKHGLLFGDLPSDKKMKGTLSTTDIAFLNESPLESLKKDFDIVLTDNSSFMNVSKLLIKK